MIWDKRQNKLLMCSSTKSAAKIMKGTTMWYMSHNSAAFIYEVVGSNSQPSFTKLLVATPNQRQE
jgi:hypothetical protein